MGDNKDIEVCSKGYMVVCMQDGGVKLIHNVYYVPKLAHNLLSVGQLTRNGFKVMFDEQMCSVVSTESGDHLVDV